MAEQDKIAQYKRQLEAYEAEDAEKAKRFDLKALAEDTRRIHVINDAELGEIRYGLLTWKEFKALSLESVEDNEEKFYRVIHAMLRKAEPDYSWEDFEAMPFHVKAVLATRLSQVFPRFLAQPQNTQLSGLKPT